MTDNNLSSKDKIEMLEKEANLLLKELVVYLTILGSVIMFFFKNLTFNIDKTQKISEIEVMILIFLTFILAMFCGNILGSFLFWITSTIDRLKEIKENIRRLNKWKV